MSTTIKIKCIDQTLTYEGTPTVASGGVNEDYIQFEFGPLWDGFSKVAVFYRNKGEMYYGLVSTDNTVVVPKEVTATKGTMYLGVMGVNGDVTRTSQVLQYRIESGALDGFTPEEPTADIYQQILAELQTIRDLSAETLSNEESFEKAITEQQNTFEDKLTKQQDDYETNLNGQMTTFRTEVDAEITEKLSKVYRPCGSVATYDDLPTDAEVGDVYNLLDTGVNYAWTGTEWDSLAGIIDVSKFVAKADIVDNLTTDDSTKVLSARQGKLLSDSMDLVDVNMIEYNKQLNNITTRLTTLETTTNIQGLSGTISTPGTTFKNLGIGIYHVDSFATSFSDGSASLPSDTNTGDFYVMKLGGGKGNSYGVLLVTSPRMKNYFVLGQLWSSKVDVWTKIGG